MSVISISATVGLNAANRYQDVINLQVMLNHFIGNKKLLGYQPLSLDGKCGPKTREAIMAFQFQNGLVSGEHFQAQVQPGGPTISFMNKNAGHIPSMPGGSPSNSPAKPPSDAEAVAAAMTRINEVYNLTAAEEAQWKIILTSVFKSEFAGFSSATDAAGTVSNIHKWADFALDVVTIWRTGFGPAHGTFLYTAGAISWSIGQVLGFLGPFLQFYSFIVALDHAMQTDCRIYGAIGTAYGTAYWVHGGLKPVGCKAFLSNWETEPPQYTSKPEDMERHWRSSFGHATTQLDAFARKQLSGSAMELKSASDRKRALRAPLQTIDGTTLSRAVLTCIAKEYRAHGDVLEADAIGSYAKNTKLRYPY